MRTFKRVLIHRESEGDTRAHAVRQLTAEEEEEEEDEEAEDEEDEEGEEGEEVC